jgi:hypothetical protein
MAHPKVVDAEDGLQMWWVAVNILNRQSWTANRSGLLSKGLRTPHSKKKKKKLVTKC